MSRPGCGGAGPPAPSARRPAPRASRRPGSGAGGGSAGPRSRRRRPRRRRAGPPRAARAGIGARSRAVARRASISPGSGAADAAPAGGRRAALTIRMRAALSRRTILLAALAALLDARPWRRRPPTRSRSRPRSPHSPNAEAIHSTYWVMFVIDRADRGRDQRGADRRRASASASGAGASRRASPPGAARCGRWSAGSRCSRWRSSSSASCGPTTPARIEPAGPERPRRRADARRSGSRALPPLSIADGRAVGERPGADQRPGADRRRARCRSTRSPSSGCGASSIPGGDARAPDLHLRRARGPGRHRR